MAISDNTYEVDSIHCTSDLCKVCDMCSMFYNGTRILESDRHAYVALGCDGDGPCIYYRDKRGWIYRTIITMRHTLKWIGIIVTSPLWIPAWIIWNIIRESAFKLTPEQIGKLSSTNLYTAYGFSWGRIAIGWLVADYRSSTPPSPIEPLED
jgi:hypothetical protein